MYSHHKTQCLSLQSDFNGLDLPSHVTLVLPDPKDLMNFSVIVKVGVHCELKLMGHCRRSKENEQQRRTRESQVYNSHVYNNNEGR
jgi:hypothetical protein